MPAVARNSSANYRRLKTRNLATSVVGLLVFLLQYGRVQAACCEQVCFQNRDPEACTNEIPNDECNEREHGTCECTWVVVNEFGSFECIAEVTFDNSDDLVSATVGLTIILPIVLGCLCCWTCCYFALRKYGEFEDEEGNKQQSALRGVRRLSTLGAQAVHNQHHRLSMASHFSNNAGGRRYSQMSGLSMEFPGVGPRVSNMSGSVRSLGSRIASSLSLRSHQSSVAGSRQNLLTRKPTSVEVKFAETAQAKEAEARLQSVRKQRIVNASAGEPMAEQEALTFAADGTIKRRVGGGSAMRRAASIPKGLLEGKPPEWDSTMDASLGFGGMVDAGSFLPDGSREVLPPTGMMEGLYALDALVGFGGPTASASSLAGERRLSAQAGLDAQGSGVPGTRIVTMTDPRGHQKRVLVPILEMEAHVGFAGSRQAGGSTLGPRGRGPQTFGLDAEVGFGAGGQRGGSALVRRGRAGPARSSKRRVLRPSPERDTFELVSDMGYMGPARRGRSQLRPGDPEWELGGDHGLNGGLQRESSEESHDGPHRSEVTMDADVGFGGSGQRGGSKMLRQTSRQSAASGDEDAMSASRNGSSEVPRSEVSLDADVGFGGSGQRGGSKMLRQTSRQSAASGDEDAMSASRNGSSEVPRSEVSLDADVGFGGSGQRGGSKMLRQTSRQSAASGGGGDGSQQEGLTRYVSGGLPQTEFALDVDLGFGGSGQRGQSTMAERMSLESGTEEDDDRSAGVGLSSDEMISEDEGRVGLDSDVGFAGPGGQRGASRLLRPGDTGFKFEGDSGLIQLRGRRRGRPRSVQASEAAPTEGDGQSVDGEGEGDGEERTGTSGEEKRGPRVTGFTVEGDVGFGGEAQRGYSQYVPGKKTGAAVELSASVGFAREAQRGGSKYHGGYHWAGEDGKGTLFELEADLVGGSAHTNSVGRWLGEGKLLRRASLPTGLLETRELPQPSLLDGLFGFRGGGIWGRPDEGQIEDHMRSGAGLWPDMSGEARGSIDTGPRSLEASLEFPGGPGGIWGQGPMAAFQHMMLLQGTGLSLDGAVSGEVEQRYSAEGEIGFLGRERSSTGKNPIAAFQQMVLLQGTGGGGMSLDGDVYGEWEHPGTAEGTVGFMGRHGNGADGNVGAANKGLSAAHSEVLRFGANAVELEGGVFSGEGAVEAIKHLQRQGGKNTAEHQSPQKKGLLEGRLRRLSRHQLSVSLGYAEGLASATEGYAFPEQGGHWGITKSPTGDFQRKWIPAPGSPASVARRAEQTLVSPLVGDKLASRRGKIPPILSSGLGFQPITEAEARTGQAWQPKGYWGLATTPAGALQGKWIPTAHVKGAQPPAQEEEEGRKKGARRMTIRGRRGWVQTHRFLMEDKIMSEKRISADGGAGPESPVSRQSSGLSSPPTGRIRRVPSGSLALPTNIEMVRQSWQLGEVSGDDEGPINTPAQPARRSKGELAEGPVEDSVTVVNMQGLSPNAQEMISQNVEDVEAGGVWGKKKRSKEEELMDDLFSRFVGQAIA